MNSLGPVRCSTRLKTRGLTRVANRSAHPTTIATGQPVRLPLSFVFWSATTEFAFQLVLLRNGSPWVARGGSCADFPWFPVGGAARPSPPAPASFPPARTRDTQRWLPARPPAPSPPVPPPPRPADQIMRRPGRGWLGQPIRREEHEPARHCPQSDPARTHSPQAGRRSCPW